DEISILTSGYSLPSSHLIVSLALAARVERVRNLKSEVTSWKTTSRYSGWMPAFMAYTVWEFGTEPSILAVRQAQAQAGACPTLRRRPAQPGSGPRSGPGRSAAGCGRCPGHRS